MLAATKAITVEAAQETDTSKSKNKSSGFSAGVVIGPTGISPTVSGNIGKGNSSGTDVTNIESQLIAGGTATIVTPDAVVMRGGTLEADTVRIGAGSLKSLVVFAVMAIASFATLRGITGVLRVNTVDRVAVELSTGSAIPRWLAAAAGWDAGVTGLVVGGLVGLALHAAGKIL